MSDPSASVPSPSAAPAGGAVEGAVEGAGPPADRRVLLVAGAGRSGTSTAAGLMRVLGLHLPQPEVPPDASNPKGFAEPQWLVDFHARLLREAVVEVSDARPTAWFEAGEVGLREPARLRAAEWLGEQLALGDEVVLKDPRLAWFLPLWRVAAIRAGATPVVLSMLRAPAEVVGSKQTWYGGRLGPAHLTASWLNMQLHVERATRPDGEVSGAGQGPRVFVRYADLLEDWVGATQRVGRTLGLRHVLDASSEQVREGHRFVDPSLRRTEVSLADLPIPLRLRELAEESWSALGALADEGGETPQVHAVLDDLREAYVVLYDESEAITRSSVVAVRQRQRPGGRPSAQPARRDPASAQPEPEPGPGAGAEPGADETSYAADAVPHAVRALVPPAMRRGVRRAIGRER